MSRSKTLKRRLLALVTASLVLASLVPASALVSASPAPAEEGLFQLQILHSSDNESAFQDPNTLEPKILHYATLVEGLRKLAPNGRSIHLTAGDHTLPGPFYTASAEVPWLKQNGLADIEFFNAMGLVANGMGNHEFDGGINDFAHMLSRARYPFISANLDFSKVQLEEGVPPILIGEDAQEASTVAGKVVRSAYVTVGGEKIGLVSRAPADFFNTVKDPDTTVPGLDFYGGRDPQTNQPKVSAVTQVLEQVAKLEAKGVNKIILVDHAQDFTGDPLSAQKLRGIDIIVAAGSTGFMGKAEADGPFNLLRKGNTPSAFYPTTRLDSEGNLVLVVNSDQLYTYVGHLIVSFDAHGRLVNVDPRSGPVATTTEAIAALEKVLGEKIAPPARVTWLFDQLRKTPTIQEAFASVGTTTAVLNGNRADVRGRETNLGRLAADSTLWYARKVYPNLNVEIALKNGGGIRSTILGPEITNLTIGAALAFNNKQAVVQLTGAELLATMENAVSRVPAADGRFPQIAGMTLEYDASKPGVSDQVSMTTPSRVKSLKIHRSNGTVDVLVEDYQAKGDLNRLFTLVTNDFLLTGGDGYQSLKAAAEARGAQRSEIGERQILAEYIQEALKGKVDLPEPLADPRVVRVDAQ
ncbi:MAG: bifunctional metallophosphatase/5'-nucleotidase [Bacillota bacterium]